MFALLGEIPFFVIGSPEAFASIRNFHYAEQRVVEDQPRLQWIGDGLENIILTLLFHASFTNPTLQYDAILAAAQDHQARPLILGNGTFRGFFVIESLTTRDIQLAPDASPIAIRVQARLREWMPDMVPGATALPQPATTPIGIAPAPISYALPASPTTATAPATTYVAPIFALPGVSALVDNPAPSGAAGPNVSYMDVPAAAIVRSG
jgi:phage protein U